MSDLFLDNDILWKLAHLDMLDEGLASIGTPPHTFRCLSTAPYSLGIRGKGLERARKKFGAQVVDRLATFWPKVIEISVVTSQDEVQRLSEVPSLDPGESILLSECGQIDTGLLISGDKRAITAFHEATGFDDLRIRLAGKVWCFEAVLNSVLMKYDFDHVAQRIFDGRDCDGSLRLVVGREIPRDSAPWIDALNSFIEDLRRKSPSILAP